MDVSIDNESLLIGGRGVAYDDYYLLIEGGERRSPEEVLKAILAQWAGALETAADGEELFLPFGLDDENVECFRASVRGDRVVLRWVRVWENAYAMNLTDLRGFMAGQYEVIEEASDVFGEYGREELVSALRNARAVTGGQSEGEQ